MHCLVRKVYVMVYGLLHFGPKRSRDTSSLRYGFSPESPYDSCFYIQTPPYLSVGFGLNNLNDKMWYI